MVKKAKKSKNASRKLEFDRATAARAVSPDTPGREVEARMGQYLAAFGSGAGDTHIPRAVVDLLRYRYLPCIERMVTKNPRAWDTEGPWVLSLMRGEGRLAASFALARGEITIRALDAWTAAEKVEAATRVIEPLPTGNHPPGYVETPVWCVPVRRPGKPRK